MSSLATQQQTRALVTTTAQGMLSVLAISGMSGFMAAGMAAGASTGSKVSLQKQLYQVNEKIRKVSYVLEQHRSSIVSLRNRRVVLMHEHGLTISPSLYELKKYPQLREVERRLIVVDKGLARLEVKDVLLKKERKRLQIALGVRAEEPEKRVRYAATKKFQEPYR